MRYHQSGLSPEGFQTAIAHELITYAGMTPVGEKWTDSTTPRTDAPILFRPFMGRSVTFYTGRAARFISR